MFGRRCDKSLLHDRKGDLAFHLEVEPGPIQSIRGDDGDLFLDPLQSSSETTLEGGHLSYWSNISREFGDSGME